MVVGIKLSYIPAKAKALPHEGALAPVNWSQPTGPQLLPANRPNHVHQMHDKGQQEEAQHCANPGQLVSQPALHKKQYAREGRALGLGMWQVSRHTITSVPGLKSARDSSLMKYTSRISKAGISSPGLHACPSILLHKPTCPRRQTNAQPLTLHS